MDRGGRRAASGRFVDLEAWVTLPDGGQSGTRGHGAGASLSVAQIPMQSMNHGEVRRKDEDQVGKERIGRKAQKPIAHASLLE
jgi:hypothetical protein